jgi:hypothetical protein
MIGSICQNAACVVICQERDQGFKAVTLEAKREEFKSSFFFGPIDKQNRLLTDKIWLAGV